MNILALNIGSSSLKFQVFEVSREGALSSLDRGLVSPIGPGARCSLSASGGSRPLSRPVEDHGAAAHCVLDHVAGGKTPFPEGVAAVAHRLVHGGDVFFAPAVIDDEVAAAIEALAPLAPLHNPPALKVIRACRERFGAAIPMVAVFDTAFHHRLPEHARAYALPADWTVTRKIRRYGFHGLAHRYLFERYLEVSGAPRETTRAVTFQLGQGCSMAAVAGGISVDTSMGFTPMEGLVMATRSGDVDPGVLLHLMEHAGVSPQELDEGLNRRSGLLGLSGLSADMQVLLRAESEGHAGARRATAAFVHRVRKYLGAYLAVLGGAEAILFGGGIGENSAEVRSRVCAGMEWCGLILDEDANRAAAGREALISAPRSRIAAWVLPVNEELVMARDAAAILGLGRGENPRPEAMREGKGPGRRGNSPHS